MVNVLPVLAEIGDVRIVDAGDQQPVVTARDLARALGYRQEWAVHNLYNRNKESFAERDVGVIKMMTPSGEQWVRYFTKRGALKVCMKSNQPKAIQVQELLIDLFEQVERGRLVPVQQFNALAQQVDRLAQQLEQATNILTSLVVDLTTVRQSVTKIAAAQDSIQQQLTWLNQKAHYQPAGFVPQEPPETELARQMLLLATSLLQQPKPRLDVSADQELLKNGKRYLHKIEKMGAEEVVLELRKAGLTMHKIAEILTKASGQQVSAMAVCRFLKNYS